MVHKIDTETRKTVRGIITTIRTRHNCSREVAEKMFRKAVSDSDVVDAIMEQVDENIEDERFMACGGV